MVGGLAWLCAAWPLLLAPLLKYQDFLLKCPTRQELTRLKMTEVMPLKLYPRNQAKSIINAAFY